MENQTVLLVDDHAAVRSGLRLLLQNAGFEVLEAATGEQTHGCLSKSSVQLVLLDTQLEGEDGIELAAQLRTHHPQLPLAMLSMHSDMNQVRRAVRAGVNGYVLKHADGEEVVAAARLLVFGGFYLDSRLAEAFLKSPPEARHSRQESLTGRKRMLLDSLRANLSNQEMAERLNLSVSSVKACLRELYEEYQVKDRTGLLLATQGLHPF